MVNILSKAFTVKPADTPKLSDFFEAISEMDSHIRYLPMNSALVYTPSTEADEVPWFSADEYSCNFQLRASKEELLSKVKIDSLIDAGEGKLDEFINELIAFKDSLFVLDSNSFFVTEEAFRGFAKLSGLSGDALKDASKYRDDYIASLIQKRCSISAKKRRPVPAFTAIAFEDCGILRAFEARSGNYTAIPQSVLKKVYESLMEADDWGEVVCKNWYIDHDISYVDLEFPDLSESLRNEYPECFKEKTIELPLIPGIRLSTGSTGWNALKVSMTWRRPESSEPAIYESVTQKHCKTYEDEGDKFIESVHENIWSRYGELPARLAELFIKPLSTEKVEIEALAGKIIKELNLRKIFMQKDTPISEDADYCKKIQNCVTESIFYMDNPTCYDMAIEFIDIADRISVADSYKESLKNTLLKVPFCKAFDI